MLADHYRIGDNPETCHILFSRFIFWNITQVKFSIVDVNKGYVDEFCYES